MEKLVIRNSISIDASPERVWRLLTDPEQTKLYMFGSEAISDWQVGSPLIWKGQYEGQEMIFVKGEVKEIRPGEFLAYTVFDPNNKNIPDLPENYLTVAYSLIKIDQETLLTVTQGDYNLVADGERRYKESYNNGRGWMPILEQIKILAEEQAAVNK